MVGLIVYPPIVEPKKNSDESAGAPLSNHGRRAISVAIAFLDDRLFLNHVRPTILLNDDLVTRLTLADNFLLPHYAVRPRANSDTSADRSDAYPDPNFFGQNRRAERGRSNENKRNVF